MGIPSGAVRQALQKEGKDPNIIDMDPEKSYASQVKNEVEEEKKDSAAEGPALKDDPEYTKFFKMLKVSCIIFLQFHFKYTSYSKLFISLNYCRWAYRLVQYRTL